MLKHALDDTIGAPSVLGDLFEVAGQQPDDLIDLGTSALSLWFRERVRRLGGRIRKTIIVALARKLLVALWRYTTAEIVIEGGRDEGSSGDDLTPSART
jgi:hypothetical protein